MKVVHLFSPDWVIKNRHLGNPSLVGTIFRAVFTPSTGPSDGCRLTRFGVDIDPQKEYVCMAMRMRSYGVARLDLDRGLKYVVVYVPGRAPEIARVKSLRWWRVHCRAALVARQVRRSNDSPKR